VLPILAKANTTTGALPTIGVHPMKAANRESHHVRATKLETIIHDQYHQIAVLISSSLKIELSR
jgi:hypothetical protein